MNKKRYALLLSFLLLICCLFGCVARPVQENIEDSSLLPTEEGTSQAQLEQESPVEDSPTESEQPKEPSEQSIFVSGNDEGTETVQAAQEKFTTSRHGLTSYAHIPILEQGDIYYFPRQTLDGISIYKIKSEDFDKSVAEYLFDSGPGFYELQVVGDWLYFTTGSPDSKYPRKIYQVSTDGQTSNIIAEDGTSSKYGFATCAVLDGWVYYGATVSEQVDASTTKFFTYLCRVSVDGTAVEPLTPVQPTKNIGSGIRVWTVTSEGTLILRDQQAIYTYNPGDATLTPVLTEDDIAENAMIYPYEGGIVVLRPHKGFFSYANDLTSSESLEDINQSIEEITAKPIDSSLYSISSYTVTQEEIYLAISYWGNEQATGIYRISFDGEWVKINNDGKATSLILHDDGYLYYVIEGTQPAYDALYRVRPNGSDWEEIHGYQEASYH